MVEYLLSGGATISEKHRGEVVIVAADKGHLHVVEYLFSGGATISIKDQCRAYWSAARNNHLHVLKYLAGTVLTPSVKVSLLLGGAAIVILACKGANLLFRNITNNRSR